MSAAAAETRVKVCGLTTAADVRAAAVAGAWALGFVLTRSPRQVLPEEVAGLARAAVGVPPPGPARSGAALTVAVFTTETAAEIAAAARIAAVTAVQLSGGVDGPGCAEVRAAMRAAGCGPTALIAAPDCAGSDTADYLLLDARFVAADAGDQTVYGGSGRALDWDQLELPLDRRVVLAGGITPANAATAIRRLRPYAIDVCSGVESSPGVKDHSMLAALFAAVAGEDAAENRERERE